MGSKITIPEYVCDDEVVDYLASRYSITPRQVINSFLYEEGVMDESRIDGGTVVAFEENEMAILRDMGFSPLTWNLNKLHNIPNMKNLIFALALLVTVAGAQAKTLIAY